MLSKTAKREIQQKHFKILNRFQIMFEKGEILHKDDSNVHFKRSQYAKNECMSWNSLTGAMTSLENRFYQLKSTLENSGLTILSEKKDFIFTIDAIKVSCPTCNEISHLNYQTVSNYRRHIKKYGDVYCFACREKMWYQNSKNNKYKKLEDLALIDKAKKLYQELESNISDFIHADVTLYKELNSRNVTTKILDSFPKIKYNYFKKENYKSLFTFFMLNFTTWNPAKYDYLNTLNQEQWQLLVEAEKKKYPSWLEFSKRHYTGLMEYAKKNGVWDSLYFKYFGRYRSMCVGLNNTKYASFSELYVGNLLNVFGLKHKYDEEWPFSGLSQDPNYKAKYDFYLCDFDVYIEVWMRNKSNIHECDKNSKKINKYLERREDKEQKIKNLNLNLISIESSHFRGKWNLKNYLYRILVNLVNANIFSKDYINTKNIILNDSSQEIECKEDLYKNLVFCEVVNRENWDINDWCEYFNEQGYKSMNDYYRHDSCPLSGKKNKMLRKEIENYLHEKNGRKVPSNIANRLSLDKLKVICQEIGITNKPEYEKAYKEGMLPVGAPCNILQSYKVHWSEFFGRCPRGKLIYNYHEAKKIVSSLAIKSKTEFNKAKHSNDEKYKVLKCILKNPDNNVSGGYKDWVSWYDFLGNEPAAFLNPEVEYNKQILKNGELKEVVVLLQSKNVTKISDVDKMFHHNALIGYLENNKLWLDIQIGFRGTIRGQDKIKDEHFISSFLKPEWIIAEKHWIKFQKKNPAYKIFLTKLHNSFSDKTWSNVQYQNKMNYSIALRANEAMSATEIFKLYKLWKIRDTVS